MTSVIIAAFNEAAVIGRNLDLLLAGAEPGELDVVVVANGCTDETAEVARRRGVRVLELAEPGKAGALNAGDDAAEHGLRVYLDADIAASAATVRALAAALTTAPSSGGPTPLVAVPARRLVLDGRPIVVRAYYAIQSRLPAARSGLYGRGMIALSPDGRARFDRFPDVLADDLFLDSLFTDDERVVVASVRTAVQTPRRTGDLVRRLTRVRRGNAALRARPAVAGSPGVRASSRTSWLRDVVLPRPWLAPAGVVYAAVTLLAEVRARRDSGGWEHDTSSRRGTEPGGTV
ncbi:MAG: glycosyltransferase [Actinomycetales bacterium]|nr:glycosyltransferase [Actinomycetales bacterium]